MKKRMTIKDMAKKCGFSIATISKVLNGKDKDISEETRKIIIKAAEENNFQLNRAASSLVSKKTKTIGLLIPDISNPFFSDIAKGIENFAYSKGYSVFLCNSNDQEKKEISYLKSMIQLNVDGILLVGTQKENKFKNNFKFEQPVISIDREPIYSYIKAQVKTDHYQGAKDAVKFLIKNGHKNILFIGGPSESNSAIQRYNAYLDTMKKHKLEINLKDIKFGNFSIEHGYNTIINLKNIYNYSAIFCCNDLIAIGAISALKKLNFNLPDDMSIIGIDDVELAKFTHPTLTTMKQSAYNLGYESGKLLIDYILNNTKLKNMTFKQELIVRDSVKNIK